MAIVVNTTHLNRFPRKTASGSIVSISDALPFAADAVVADISPVQDLHGYSNPWPDGGGTNILPLTETVTKYNVKLTNNGGGKYTLNGTNNGIAVSVFDIRVSYPSGAYTLSAFNPVVNSNVQFYAVDANNNVPINISCDAVNKSGTANISNTLTTIRIRVLKNATVDNFVIYPMLVKGSTAPASFSPYSNVCPISGFTGVNLYKRGKNLINVADFSLVMGTNRTKSIMLSPTIPEETYVVSFNVTSNNTTKTVTFSIRDKNGTGFTAYTNVQIAAGATGRITNKFTASGSIGYIYVYENSSEASGKTITIADIQLERSSSSSDYEPYTGTTIPIDWTSTAGTVYGGSLDVVSGVLTVNYKYYTNSGTGNWGEVTTGGSRYYIGGVSTDAVSADTTGACNLGLLVSDYYQNGIQVSNNGRINMCGTLHSAFASVDALKTYLSSNPLQVVYKLATPLTYQLTPQQITMLMNNNTLWTDIGTLSVTYKAKRS